jgi:hypothetical protein
MKTLLLAAMLAIASFTASAAAPTTSLDPQFSSFIGETSTQTDNALFFGSGDHTFTLDLGPGTYSLNLVGFFAMDVNPITSVLYNGGGTIPELTPFAYAYMNTSGPGGSAQKFTLTSPFTMSFAVADAGNYMGALQVTDYYIAPTLPVTPAVPEPASAALLLAGLAGIGFMAKRRQSK